jgi:predicted RNase H-like nuclease
LAGVVPCPGGWLTATAKLQGITVSPEEPKVFSSFLAVLDYKPAFQVVGLFTPVGLLDAAVPRGRQCDRDARSLLGRRRAGAVMSAPARVSVHASSRSEAAMANGGRLSAVSWRLMEKIAEVEDEMAPYLQRTVFEVHPELSFYQLNGDSPLRYSKHTMQGRAERRALLERRLPGVERILDARIPRVNRAHLLDAAACLWTARRIVSRQVDRIPRDPEWDSKGLRMEMVR